MCVTWVHAHSCDHQEAHEHRCYSYLLNRPCDHKYQCDLLETEIPCRGCMSKRWRRLEGFRLESNRIQYQAMLEVMEENQERLLGVIKHWHETVAGSSKPVLAVLDGEAESGWTDRHRAYIPTPEWKAKVSKIIRDEIAPYNDEDCECQDCEVEELSELFVEHSNINEMREVVEGWLEEEKGERVEAEAEGYMHLVTSTTPSSSDPQTSESPSEDSTKSLSPAPSSP